jgi:hypothetical protein
MTAIGDDLEVKVPDVEVEDEQAFVVGIVLRIAGRAQVVEADLPVQSFPLH